MLGIRLLEAHGQADRATAQSIFSEEYLIRRPLLQALESNDGVAPLLLIDEIDRADEAVESARQECDAICAWRLGFLRRVGVLGARRERDIPDVGRKEPEC